MIYKTINKQEIEILKDKCETYIAEYHAHKAETQDKWEKKQYSTMIKGMQRLLAQL
jgi:hypothetical protein